VIQFKETWRRHHKENRFLFFSFLLLLGLSTGAYYLYQRTQAASAQELTNRLLLFLLWYLDISLILTLSFIILRSVFKLIVESRAGILGARFRTKLIFTYIALTSIPVIFIFLIATNLLQHSIDRWFSAPVEEILGSGRKLAVELRKLIEDRLAAQSLIAARSLAEDSSQENLARLQRSLGVDLLEFFDQDRLIEAVSDARRIPGAVPPLKWEENKDYGVRAERWSGGLLMRAWRRMEDGRHRVVVGAILPPQLLGHLERAIAADTEFQSLKQRQGTITATTILVFLSITLLLLFVTVWIGLYLSRRFTEPLRVVTDATRRVAAGDALEEVTVRATDEVAVLVDSFNAMVRRVRSTQEEIRASNEELSTLLATIPTGVLSINSEGTRFRPNDAAAKMLGSPKMAAMWHPLGLLGELGLDQLYQRLLPGRPVRESFSLDMEINGEARHFEVTRRPLPGGGVMVAMDDLSELILAQRQAAWSDAAQRIAHEIKNPLTPIRLAAERIERRASRIGGETGEVLRSSCRAIVAHVTGLKTLVDAFQEYARMPEVRPRVQSLGEIVRETTAIYEDLSENLELISEFPAGEVQAMADPVLLRQVLVNLIDNAVAATGGNGEIRIVVTRDSMSAVIEVLDNGPGLPTEDIELLTRPFFSTKGRGSGMGLAIVDRIIRDHGGTLDISNRSKGSGTRVLIRLPGAGEGLGKAGNFQK